MIPTDTSGSEILALCKSMNSTVLEFSEDAIWTSGVSDSELPVSHTEQNFFLGLSERVFLCCSNSDTFPHYFYWGHSCLSPCISGGASHSLLQPWSHLLGCWIPWPCLNILAARVVAQSNPVPECLLAVLKASLDKQGKSKNKNGLGFFIKGGCKEQSPKSYRESMLKRKKSIYPDST